MSHSCRLICSQHVFKMYFCASSLFFFDKVRLESLAEKRTWGICAKMIASVHGASGLPTQRSPPPRLHVILHMHITRLTPAVPQETKHSIIIYSAAPHYRWVHVFPLMWNDLLMTPWWLLIVECHSFLEHAWYFPLVFRFYFLHIC